MNEINVTVAGVVGSDIRFTPGDKGARAGFRLASSSRYFDKAKGSWTDGPTTWLDVVCWRRLAEHVYDCVKKGEPVIVVGRLQVRAWETETSKGRTPEITATAVGHDLTWGRAKYERRRPDAIPTDEAASPANESHAEPSVNDEGSEPADWVA